MNAYDCVAAYAEMIERKAALDRARDDLIRICKHLARGGEYTPEVKASLALAYALYEDES